MPTLTNCVRCGYVSSQEICKACILLEGLNKGLPKLGIGKSSKVKRILQENEKKNNCCSTNKNKTCENVSNESNIDNVGDKKCLCNGSQDIKPFIKELVIDKLTI